ncbi:MAG: NusG domain II-containing protein [Eubacterium sp.]|nr:NusG domain II-containing protein [Eubacterium sp.]
MFQIIKKADIILFVCLVIIGCALSYFAFVGNESGDKVIVKVNGEIYGKYDLKVDRTITVEKNGHMNKVTIKNGKVQVSESSCKNQVCVKQGAISGTHQSLVCLPNKLVVVIEGKAGEYDVISQ